MKKMKLQAVLYALVITALMHTNVFAGSSGFSFNPSGPTDVTGMSSIDVNLQFTAGGADFSAAPVINGFYTSIQWDMNELNLTNVTSPLGIDPFAAPGGFEIGGNSAELTFFPLAGSLATTLDTPVTIATLNFAILNPIASAFDGMADVWMLAQGASSSALYGLPEIITLDSQNFEFAGVDGPDVAAVPVPGAFWLLGSGLLGLVGLRRKKD